ncbi:methylaspartate mutase accessory protein GlmL [Tepidanaerobacter sp. EBM-38]|uniref:methylaspartate mutase accessory protein GlmL n=1 Tax=Tepidanaerobacter sp. EBM-38 TaxID=1918496 RepID=UPI000ACDD6EF|nr:methylaspartate mutase accessory protein GlmL [Tepidanaerobacter sp. EBM-38]
MELALLIDIGSTYTKVTAVDLETVELKGTAQAATTVAEDVNIGINKAIEELKAMGVDPEKAKYKLACSSAAGGLKMIAVGLVPELTSEAAKRAALGAGAKVGHVFCYELTDDELDQIARYSPDIILLAGGTDGGNKDVIIHNAEKLAELKVDAPIIVAGNKTAASAAEKALRAAAKEVYVTENVMPKLECLNIEPAKKIIREVFLSKIIYAKGLSKVSNYVDSPIIPTPSAVMKAAELLAKGSDNEAGYGEVMIVDIGGATTDVDSAATGEPTKAGVTLRGLEEPFIKRTVEGDLGMRYSALALLEEIGIKNMLKNYLPCGMDEKTLQEYVKKISIDTDYVPCNEMDKQIDCGIAKAATDLAVKRHVGRIETVYSPFGAAYVQHGKDLTKLDFMIATGGVLIYSENPKEILKHGLYDSSRPEVLAPENPKMLLDEKYLLSSLGLLSEIAPDKALNLAKKYLKEL